MLDLCILKLGSHTAQSCVSCVPLFCERVERVCILSDRVARTSLIKQGGGILCFFCYPANQATSQCCSPTWMMVLRPRLTFITSTPAMQSVCPKSGVRGGLAWTVPRSALTFASPCTLYSSHGTVPITPSINPQQPIAALAVHRQAARCVHCE